MSENRTTNDGIDARQIRVLRYMLLRAIQHAEDVAARCVSVLDNAPEAEMFNDVRRALTALVGKDDPDSTMDAILRAVQYREQRAAQAPVAAIPPPAA